MIGKALKASIALVAILRSADAVSADNLIDRIAIVRDRIRRVVEQAAAQQGAAYDDRVSQLLEQPNKEFDEHLAQRVALDER